MCKVEPALSMALYLLGYILSLEHIEVEEMKECEGNGKGIERKEGRVTDTKGMKK
jgi:hypothetical protein